MPHPTDLVGPPGPPVPATILSRDRRAVAAGPAAAEWYHTKVPRKRMKALMARRDGPAVRDTLVWALLL